MNTAPGKCPYCDERWTDHTGVEEPLCRDDRPYVPYVGPPEQDDLGDTLVGREHFEANP